MKKEIWKDVPNYEGFYQVSNMGRVRSVDRVIPYKSRQKTKTKGKVLSLIKLTNGYIKVSLRKKGTHNQQLVHRLVGETFIPNPENKETINHLNGIKDDNRVCNLEWATRSENDLHAFKIGLRNTNYLKKEVELYNDKGLSYIFESTVKAGEFLGVHRSNISMLINGKLKKVRGFYGEAI